MIRGVPVEDEVAAMPDLMLEVRQRRSSSMRSGIAANSSSTGTPLIIARASLAVPRREARAMIRGVPVEDELAAMPDLMLELRRCRTSSMRSGIAATSSSTGTPLIIAWRYPEGKLGQ